MIKKNIIFIFAFLSIYLYSKEKLHYMKLVQSDFFCLFDLKIKRPFYNETYKLRLGSAKLQLLESNNIKLYYNPATERPEPFVYLEYNIEDDILYTYLNKEKSNKLELIPDELKREKLTWTLEKDETNLYSNEKLVSNTNFTLWNIKSQPPEGSTRYVDNTKIYMVKQKWVKLLYNVKVRKGPGINYDYNTYNFFIYSSNTKGGLTKIDYLPKERTVLLIGRTFTKQKIDDMEDYWYYCFIEYNPMNESGEDKGWIFGALLDKMGYYK